MLHPSPVKSLRRFVRASGRTACLTAAAALLLVAGPLEAASTGDPTPGADRGIYRITPARYQSLLPLQALGLDIAGTGPAGAVDVILTAEELFRVQALGFDPRPLDLAVRGPQAAAESPLFRPDLGGYHTVAEAAQEMADYVAAHPAIAQLSTIGFTIEGRPIEAVKITDNVEAEEGEPGVVIVGCHHARELMSVELPLYLMRRLLGGYGVDPVLTRLVNEREIWIVPLVNPDGHVYVESHTGGASDGWWRKNRRVNGDGSVGVDLNRNYGWLWGYDDFGSSPTPSSEVYRGTAPFSEPETAALRDFMATHAFHLSISFHSYGDLFLYPWGYAAEDTPDHAVFQAIGDSVAAMNGYLAGNHKSGAIYLTNGDMGDWVYGEAGIKPPAYGFTFELNSAADGGFAPPDNLILPTCDRNWGPLLTLLEYADTPRRILGPARATDPGIAFGPGTVTLTWDYEQPDPANPPVRHDVRRIASYAVGPDDAEAGGAPWEASLFAVSTARSASGTHSYYSGSGNNWKAVLAMRAPFRVDAGTDSVVVTAWWALEALYDYWYAEASTDGGATWATLPGNRTTNDNPFLKNLGNGITGASTTFLRCAFSLQSCAGRQALVRFRCLTDGAVAEEGLYLDDVFPVASMSGLEVLDTGSPDVSWRIDPPPAAPSWYQVRAVDAEGHEGPWSGVGFYDPSISAAGNGSPGLARRSGLFAANPLRAGSLVRFALAAGRAGRYRLEVFDVRGRRVRELVAGDVGPTGGIGRVRWDGTGDSGGTAGSGLYFLRLTTPDGGVSIKVTFLR